MKIFDLEKISKKNFIYTCLHIWINEIQLTFNIYSDYKFIEIELNFLFIGFMFSFGRLEKR